MTKTLKMNHGEKLTSFALKTHQRHFYLQMSALYSSGHISLHAQGSPWFICIAWTIIFPIVSELSQYHNTSRTKCSSKFLQEPFSWLLGVVTILRVNRRERGKEREWRQSNSATRIKTNMLKGKFYLVCNRLPQKCFTVPPWIDSGFKQFPEGWERLGCWLPPDQKE